MKKVFLLVLSTTLYFFPLIASSASCNINNYKDFVFNHVKLNQLIQTGEVCELAGADLRLANLQGAAFLKANLKGADFQGANLRGASFFRANLEGANLRGVNLRNVDLRLAILYKASLAETILDGANFTIADLRLANLRNVRSAQAALFAETDLRHADVQGANLDGANFPSAYLQYVDLTEASLIGATYDEYTKFTKASWFKEGFDPKKAGMVILSQP